ncbi:hypothetical protein J3T65_05240 [Staphylococcus simiae]|uniref:hypothetical protein n=1 Tax=Staphylococcus simiae TaxID=308354 RepID=UPI001A956789|nr:hypothetical protein [Staphylococcus simiae]MBO1199110.1 hypothetical protein [Staphylococcus simiae]MBO1201182.1 hypothetical protein [Staphylococcus simiae]MBO1203330.1 hypothetical protein [Staphylococcus simiae]MBO1210858.1 hypothetical protein [Staphylococcus simiae]MBO1229548.1 hypothetical protein [Staphylococcus simiae]
MKIKDAYRKNVVVTLKNDEKFQGFVLDYENPFESETGNYSMDVETDDGIFSIDESVINKIKLINKHPFYTDK